MTSFLGKKISLISKAGIRYEGILYTIDPTESTVALSKVKSFGTEDRASERFIPPRDEVYEYIIFRGSDIRDLHVCETSLYSEDSAIVKIMSPNFTSQSPIHVTMPQHGIDVSAPPDMHTNNQDRSPASFNAKPSQKDIRAMKNSSMSHNKSSDRDRDAPSLFDSKPLQQLNTNPLNQQDSSGDRDPRKSDNSFDMDKIATNDYHNFLNREQSYNHRYDMFPLGEDDRDRDRDYSAYRRGGGGSNQRQRGVKHTDARRGASQFGLTGGVSSGNGFPSSRAYRVHREVTVEPIRDDFDFETSNALLAEELAHLDVAAASAVSTSTAHDNGRVGNEHSDTVVNDNGDEKPQYYDKTRSFFDSISSEMTERTNSDRRNERRSNTETFGDSNYGRGGRGNRWGNRRGQFRGNYNRGSSAGFLRRGSYFSRGDNRGRGQVGGPSTNKRLISVGGNRVNGNEN